MGGLYAATVNDMLILPFDVVEILRGELGFKGMLAGCVLESGEFEVLKNRVGRAGEGVKKSIELLLSTAVEDIELLLFF